MELNERIKYLRKEILNMTQDEFGEKMGVSRDVVNNMERGRVNIGEDRIKLICSVFSVSDKWLRNEEGEIRLEDCQESRFSVNIGKLQNTDNETIMRWVNMIAETKPEILTEIEKFMKKLIESQDEPE